MPRRLVFLIALISLAVLGVASAPWTLTGSGLSWAVANHLKDRYGLDFKVNGRSTFALLPTPQVKFENITLSFPHQEARADGGTLRGELRLWPMLLGRVELREISLSQTRISASQQAIRSLDWERLLNERLGKTHARRLIVTASSIHWTDLGGSAALEQVNMLVNWAGLGEPLSATGSVSWRGETVSIENASFDPELLASGRLSPVSLALAAPSGRLAVTGEAQLGGDPQLTGESQIVATSVRDFARWSRIKLPFGSLMRAASIKGDVSINRRRLSWPSVAVTLGTDSLEGTMAVRFDAERPVITGTLAADSLNLSNFFRPLTQTRTTSGAWTGEAIDLAQTTGSDLDLRLSATKAQIGRLQVNDMAAGVLVRPGQIEASIGRADFYDGTLKGRLSLGMVNGSAEFKSQATYNGIDLATFLHSMGEPRWITGRAQGQFVLEGIGKNPAELIRQAHGRIAVSVKEGELVGIALDDAMRRVEKRPLLASLNWRGGRTPFSQAQTSVSIKDGIGEVADGRLESPSLVTNLHGRISLVDRTLDLKADVSLATPASSPSPVPAIVFDVGGGWDNVLVTPDARALIERSGAAKPLFGPQLRPLAAPLPLVTAQ